VPSAKWKIESKEKKKSGKKGNVKDEILEH